MLNNQQDFPEGALALDLVRAQTHRGGLVAVR